MAFRVLSEDDQAELTAHLAQVAQELALPRDLCVVLEHLVCGRFVRDGSAWLAGESLPDSALAELGVSSEVVDDREEQARDVVTALCRLAGETLPIVFCFDQVEALQRSLQDQDAFFRFGRMAADLCDADQNVFLITCIQSALVEQFRSSIREADRDRMAKREAILSPLSPEQVRALVETRVRLVPELTEAERAGEFRFPPEFVEELYRLTPCVPRRVLNLAARRFEGMQRGGPLPVECYEEFLRRECASRTQSANGASSQADTTRVLLQGLEPLAALAKVEIIQDPLRQADFGLEREKRVFAEIRNEADGRSLGPRLKRLLDHTPRADGSQTIILRDPRIPIGKSATKVRERLDELKKRGVRIVEPNVAALAALAALSELLADAKSGDLANEGEPISGSAVLEWIRTLTSELAVEPVLELVNEIMADSPVVTQGDKTAVDLAELVNRERIATLTDAAEQLKATPEEVGNVARRLPERFLLLEGPPEVVLDVAGVSPEVIPS
jgi:DNA-binding Lrp family transcriptional regulator